MKKNREFPALLMTALVIGASLSSTGCLRQLTREKTTQLPSPSYMTEDISYHAAGSEVFTTQDR